MCVDYDILIDTEDNLRKIEYDLANSVEQIVNTLRNSQNFLEGNQFEKAKRITNSCVQATNITLNNITHARKYLEELKEVLAEYEQGSYHEEI